VVKLRPLNALLRSRAGSDRRSSDLLGDLLLGLVHLFVLLAVLSLLGALFWPLSAWPRDIGALGPVYPIAEPDMVDDIKGRLRAKEASGELAAIEAQARERVRRRIETPEPVPGLRRAQVARSYHFDPSVRFDETVVDAKGRVVVPAGALANPLSVVTLTSAWLLFDGRDPRQVALARAEVESSSRPVKPILVGGSPAALTREWGRQVFFDQGGRLVQRLGIQVVPARVTQDGQLLLVQEFPPP
jgi:conjugal transfer pilus assembly protein TraW